MKGLISRWFMLFLAVYIVLVGAVYFVHTNREPELLTGMRCSKAMYEGSEISDTQYSYITAPDGFIVLKSRYEGDTVAQYASFVLKVGSNGAEEWRFQLKPNIDTYLDSAWQAPNGDVFVVGDTRAAQERKQGKKDAHHKAFMMKLNRLGKQVWVRDLGSYTPHVIYADNKRVLLYKNTDTVLRIALYDDSGLPLFERSIDNTTRKDVIKQIIGSYGLAAVNAAALSVKIDDAIRRVEYASSYGQNGYAQINGKYYAISTSNESSAHGIVCLTELDDGKKVDVLSVTGYKYLTHSFTAKFVGSADSLALFTVEADAAAEAMCSDEGNSWNRHNWSALYVTDGHSARKLVELGRGSDAFNYDVSYTLRSDGSYIIYANLRNGLGNGDYYAYSASGDLLARYRIPNDFTTIKMHPNLNFIVVKITDDAYRPQTHTISLPTVACPTVKLSRAQSTGSRQVVMKCATPGADIYYTTDGKSPSRSSTKYVNPVNLDGRANLKACAFKKGLLPSICREAAFKAP